MKLCYLNILWTLDPGVLNKLSHQTRALGNALGRNGTADCLVVVRQEIAETVQKNPSLTLFPISAPGSSSMQEALLPFLVWSKLKNRLSGYDAIVTRWTVPSPTFLNVVRRQPVFTEHHSKELEEIALHRGLKPFARRILEKKYGPRILRATHGIIGVTDEIRRYELNRAGCKQPSMVLPNGISLEGIPFKPPSVFNGKSLQLAFVSSQFAPWHGLDRLLEGLRLWQDNSPLLTLHLIGRLTPTQETAIQRMGLAEMVCIHGVLYGSDLDEVLSGCHLAIGSLALHRKVLKEACALKVREYTARGLPFVISHDDPDLPAGLPWVLKIPADESPVEIDTLVNFAEGVSKLPSLAKEMRAFAEARLSWRVKMKGLAEFVLDNI
jgi:glycosyltransferase involved in cell wall biosynthesis